MRRTHTTRTVLSVAAVCTLGAATLTACGGGDTETEAASGYTGEIGAVDLSESCPATVVVQTDWNPEAEHGHLYELLGPDPTIDAAAKAVSGPLFASGEYTGVDVEIRTGGPAIGFQQVTAQMYQDPDIMLGYVDSDQAVQNSLNNPTVGVFAPLDINPQMIMWDPETYPDVARIADLKDEGTRVLYFEGNAYMDYLTGEGILDPAQVDGSYDGSPSNFVAAGGTVAQQGYASAEPFIYENEVPEWGKPVAYELLHDTGYPIYKSMMAVRSAELEDNAACLEMLVPVLQQAEVEYFADPSRTNEVIVDAVEQFNTGWVYSDELADFAVEAMLEREIVGNGPDSTIGNFDEDRLADIVELVSGIYEAADVSIAEDVTPETIATNRFIDPTIGMN
ncbi:MULTISPECIES: ABC transporter substrate-binding protein [unclassified Dietzia]|uniref:ABC transporter substrate-binding protein n=1 Tax=unclassified Dietzia TaxID=2617939 RepID=UPI0015F9AB50|nr:MULTISPECIES: ABC transporter substrate-binding protein [unclassified Dietzia]MBB1025900.1 ABC transporter substrate-binding protein [Dietzia sp. DQ12-76]MBB1027952.1 ABC transporter substrate-binding protein [Dietzia sp. DQ11-38-2]